MVPPSPMHHTSANKKLLMVNLSQDWGGGENWYALVAKSLIQKGFSVQLLSKPGSALADQAQEDDIPNILIKATTLSLLNPIKVLKLYRLMRQLQPDLVLLNASHELKFVGLIAAWAGVPHIVFRRGLSFPLKSNFINRWYFKYIVNGFLCDAQSTYESFRKSFPMIEHYPHIVIPNGIDLEKWTYAGEARIPGKIGLSARLSPEKGVDRAIAVMEVLKNRNIPATLHVLGEGPHRTELENLIREKDLAERVFLRGFVEDVRGELASCQLFLFTSWGEGTSIAVIEAMALGLPVAAYQAPAMDELIVSGETGYLVAPDDLIGLADQVQTLLSNQALRQQLSEQAQNRVKTVFSFDRVIDQFASWWQAL